MSTERFESRQLAIRGDARGSLVVVEQKRECPFPIARVYWAYGTESGVKRGFHAHRRTRQMAVCVAGSCSMLMDDGYSREIVRLERPDRGLMIEPGVWHEMSDFSPDCVLLVLADSPYDELDYIRNYEEFRNSFAQ